MDSPRIPVAPSAIAGPPSHALRPWPRSAFLALAVLLISLAASLAATRMVQSQLEEIARQQFASETDDIGAAILDRMHAINQILQGAAGLFDASNYVSQKDWQQYYSALALQENYPGILGLGFARSLSAPELTMHERQLRQDGSRAYSVWPGGERRGYAPITYLEPATAPNRHAIGFDMYSEPIRRAAMDAARDRGLAALSGKVELVQEITPGDVQAGTLMYVPVYRGGGVPPTVEERRARLFGFVYSPFRMADLMQGVLGRTPDTIRLELYDGPGRDANSLLYRSNSAPRGYLPSLSRSQELEIRGRVWTAYFETLPAFDARRDRGKPLLTLGAGVLASLLLSAIVWQVGATRARAETLAMTMTEALRDAMGQLEEHSSKLEAANRELESFSYSVSHDLKAPLRVIDGFSRILEEDYGERLDAEGIRLLHVLRDNTHHMETLIEDLLALARLGRHALRTDVIDMDELASAAWEKLAAGLVPRPEFVLAPLPDAVADRNLLWQVWTNLLSNAAKFSGRSATPRIEVSGRETADVLEYCVSDNGVGFDMAHADKLFAPFQRLHRLDEFPGTGIGLAIVQRIVAKHGGRVWAESRPGEGATFHFSLPKGGGHGTTGRTG
ncbi:MAG TPA: CHASE domain-containing protein [Aromatoleum sp.]|uniref:CHASE domain-containing protein n=1 Tax=Aromatoleum sp. TaxID=2307007 RepID=UPI002B4782C5|nr:CHASE domain-containing protein [Aromatoleum sp.]HJV24987.1 CHASE domain-containing protein [Aromatoleum sp.]